MKVAEISQLTFNFFLIFQYIISCLSVYLVEFKLAAWANSPSLCSHTKHHFEFKLSRHVITCKKTFIHFSLSFVFIFVILFICVSPSDDRYTTSPHEHTKSFFALLRLANFFRLPHTLSESRVSDSEY